MKKIIVEPCFNEAHFMKHHISNICDYFKPDIYIISEGAFPRGPEGDISVEWFKEFTLNGEGKRSFDFQELNSIVKQAEINYPTTKFYLVPMEYGDISTEDAYFKAYTDVTNWCVIGPNDLIFSLECDVFFTEEQANHILDLADDLSPNEGFGSTYKRFFESPFVEMSGITRRKIVFKYGNGQIYKLAMFQNFSDAYLTYLPIYDLQIHHYEWVRPGKYFDLRLQQLKRNRDLYASLQKARDFIQKTPNPSNTDLEKFSNLDLVPSVSKLTDFSPHILNHEKFKPHYELLHK